MRSAPDADLLSLVIGEQFLTENVQTFGKGRARACLRLDSSKRKLWIHNQLRRDDLDNAPMVRLIRRTRRCLPRDTMDQLVERARRGEPQAEQQLFSELFVRFRRFAERKAGPDSAEDVAQEACITVLNKFKSQQLEGDFFGWAHGVLRMILRRHHRTESVRKKREFRMPEHFELPARRPSQPMLRQHLMDCMRQLVRQQKKYARIYNLHQLGYSAKEVCDKMGLNVNTYYVYLGRGRAALEECLTGKGLSV